MSSPHRPGPVRLTDLVGKSDAAQQELLRTATDEQLAGLRDGAAAAKERAQSANRRWPVSIAGVLVSLAAAAPGASALYATDLLADMFVHDYRQHVAQAAREQADIDHKNAVAQAQTDEFNAYIKARTQAAVERLGVSSPSDVPGDEQGRIWSDAWRLYPETGRDYTPYPLDQDPTPIAVEAGSAIAQQPGMSDEFHRGLMALPAVSLSMLGLGAAKRVQRGLTRSGKAVNAAEHVLSAVHAQADRRYIVREGAMVAASALAPNDEIGRAYGDWAQYRQELLAKPVDQRATPEQYAARPEVAVLRSMLTKRSAQLKSMAVEQCTPPVGVSDVLRTAKVEFDPAVGCSKLQQRCKQLAKHVSEPPTGYAVEGQPTDADLLPTYRLATKLVEGTMTDADWFAHAKPAAELTQAREQKALHSTAGAPLSLP